MNDPAPIVLVTDRLVLRHLTMADLDDLARLYREPDVRRYFPDGTRTWEETREELAWIIDVCYTRYGSACSTPSTMPCAASPRRSA